MEEMVNFYGLLLQSRFVPSLVQLPHKTQPNHSERTGLSRLSALQKKQNKKQHLSTLHLIISHGPTTAMRPTDHQRHQGLRTLSSRLGCRPLTVSRIYKRNRARRRSRTRRGGPNVPLQTSLPAPAKRFHGAGTRSPRQLHLSRPSG